MAADWALQVVYAGVSDLNRNSCLLSCRRRRTTLVRYHYLTYQTVRGTSVDASASPAVSFSYVGVHGPTNSLDDAQ